MCGGYTPLIRQEAAGHQARSQDFKMGGGEILNVVVFNATRPEGPRLRGDWE